MIKKIALFLTTLALIILPAISSAATCTRADLTGTWRLYTVFDSVGRCTLNMPGAGTTISSSSTCYLPGVVSSTPLTGTLTISSDCHVTGTAAVGTQKRIIDAWISKGKDSIAGMGWKSGNPYNGDTFSGIKQ